MAYAGIDYGRGLSNINHETGIRYGVISQRAMGDGFYDVFEPVYGPPTCGHCGNDAEEVGAKGGNTLPDEAEDWPNASRYGADDYVCRLCEHYLDSSDVYGDEPAGFALNEDGIEAQGCLDSDVIVTASPFYTFGPFCSPCVPGGVSLPDDASDRSTAGPDSGLPMAFCFDHSWFEGGVAPYRVFRVSDDSEVLPEVE